MSAPSGTARTSRSGSKVSAICDKCVTSMSPVDDKSHYSGVRKPRPTTRRGGTRWTRPKRPTRSWWTRWSAAPGTCARLRRRAPTATPRAPLRSATRRRTTPSSRCYWRTRAGSASRRRTSPTSRTPTPRTPSARSSPRTCRSRRERLHARRWRSDLLTNQPNGVTMNETYQQQAEREMWDAAAQQERETAAAHREAAAESFERCDTDGFVSQWAHGVLGQQHDLQARIEERGGTWTFTGLFDIVSGKRVEARLVSTRYGRSWCIRDSRGNAAQWAAAYKSGP